MVVSNEKAANYIECPVTDTVDFGRGIEPNSGQVLQPAIELSDESIRHIPLASMRQIESIHQVSGSQSFSNTLKVSANIKADSLMWSASASANALKQSSVSTSSLSFVAILNVRTGRKQLEFDGSTLKLRQSALNDLKKGIEYFYSKYGSHFIGGLIYGGSYFGSYSMSTATSSQKSTLEANLSGSYKSAFSVEGSAKFQDEVDKTDVLKKINIEQFSDGRFVDSGVNLEIITKNLEDFKNKFDPDDEDKWGNPILAICYPWGAIQEFADNSEHSLNINPKTVGRLSSDVFEYEYYSRKASGLLENGYYVGEGQKRTLESFPSKIRPYISEINGVDSNDLMKRPEDVDWRKYEPSSNWKDDVDNIANQGFPVVPSVFVDETMTKPDAPDLLNIRPTQLSQFVVAEFFKGWGADEYHEVWHQRWVAAYQFGLMNNDGAWDSSGALGMRAVLFSYGHRPKKGTPPSPPPDVTLKPGDVVPPGFVEIFSGNVVSTSSNEPSIASWEGANDKLYMTLKWPS